MLVLASLPPDSLVNIDHLHALVCVVITSLVAIYFSETGNICPVRVLNCEIWHRHRLI